MGWHDRAGVPERRRVAAADVPAGQARPQVHPFRPEPEAFLASVRCLRVHLPDHARVGVAHRRRWRARRFASAAHLPMLAGGRGPHIIRPASSLLGHGTGLAGRGMSAGRSPAGWGVRHAQIHPPQGHPDRCHRAGGRVGRTETLTLVRHRTQSTAETIARLSVTAVFAHLVALPLPGAQPILAPLTALPDVQVSLYQTLRSAVHRVAAVARLRPPRRSPPASSARARRA